MTIRNYLSQKGASSSNELIQEWREGVLDQADLFSEFQGEESDWINLLWVDGDYIDGSVNIIWMRGSSSQRKNKI